MRRTIAVVAVVLFVGALAAGCSDDDGADEVEAGGSETTAASDDGGGDDDGGGESASGDAMLDCDALGEIVEAQVGEAPEEAFGDGGVTSMTSDLVAEQQASCSWTYPGTAARVRVTTHFQEAGATDEDRARWAGDTTTVFDPETGGQVIGERTDEGEAVTVDGIDGTAYAQADGETATLYLLVDPELGLTVSAVDYEPAASTEVLTAIAEEAVAQVA